jgi:hypothetical protein
MHGCRIKTPTWSGDILSSEKIPQNLNLRPIAPNEFQKATM